MSVFKDKVLLITGGTGSFGNAVLRRFLDSDIKEIRILSRDEKKQDDMRHFLQANRADVAHKVKFYIGDVRQREAVDFAMAGVDYVFSAAALKQVPSCEFYPMEAVRTNVEGTNNVLLSAISHGVKNVVVLSTDKAAYPINAMGISKAMMEKVAIAQGRALGADAKTTICCTRYGNVMASRGSVIPLWVEQMMEGKPITITDPNMTRYMMTLDDAVDLVIYAFEHGNNGDLFVQKAPAVTLEVLAKALKEIYAKVNPEFGKTEVKVIGTRHGEKLYETLVTREEMLRSEDMGNYFRIPCDSRDLNYDKFFTEGDDAISRTEDYHSHNTRRLDVEGMKELLLKLNFIREDLGLQSRAKSRDYRSE
ncbi:UDP-glucose 4-epimerase [Bacteroides heparinolyticus]|uniref:polysaccharide biosynthesis protein n=1 Tax=Prevotella heparinolytica TaxID=28113 RepID=UPI000D027CE3|nr:polysaccharide biosynthesis protein [Bacteroides heparinolyticus]AVM58645.1 UDP-glucose 4-epimerase [Bacteroides heparinolyticus]